MNCSKRFLTSGIFYGKKDIPMICKLTPKESINSKYQFTIEIAPNVDNLIMIALVLGIA